MLQRAALLLVLVTAASGQIQPPPGPTAPIEAAFTGVVEPIAATKAVVCGAPTHQLACNGGLFTLASSTLDLSQYEGLNVKLYGTGVPGCTLFEIHDVELPPPATLALCGTAGLGCTVRLKSGPGGLAQHVLFASLQPGFAPITSFKGSLLLGEPFFYLSKGQSFGFTDGVNFDFGIPFDAALDGLSVWFQVARRDIPPFPLGPAPFQFSNAVCLTIQGVPLWCEPADC